MSVSQSPVYLYASAYIYRSPPSQLCVLLAYGELIVSEQLGSVTPQVVEAARQTPVEAVRLLPVEAVRQIQVEVARDTRR